MDQQDLRGQEPELEEFNLEDILKEFGGNGAASEEVAAEEVFTEEEPERSALEETPVSGVADATIRLDQIPNVQGQVHNAQPILDEEEEEVRTFAPAQEESAEPYSDQWEPEYEQPIAEYVPPRPILFHPRSRLRELKKKLVNGPERLYYELSKKGLGKLQLAIFASLLVVLLSAGATALYAAGMVGENRMRLMVFGQFLAMLVSALLGSFQLLEGAVDLVRKRFSLNTMLVFSFLICCVDGVLCLRQLRVPCCAAFSLQVTMSLWNTYHKRITKLGQLDTMRKAIRLHSIVPVEDYLDETTGLIRGEGQVEDFMDTLDQPSKREKVISVYALVCLGVSIAAGVTAGVLHGISAGIQVASVTTLAALPASLFVALSRPMAVLERRHHRLGAVLCGWQGVEGLSKKVMFPLTHGDLLPATAVKMNGVKFYGSRQPDEIISYAAALVAADGGSLTHLFNHLLDSRNGMHYDVTQFHRYENGGIGGQIHGEPVLVGTQSFLKDMGVDMPEGIRVHQAVCVAVDGELCGLFAVVFEKDNSSSAGFATLCSYRKLKPVIVGGDFLLTETFLKEFFDVKTKRVVFPETQLREDLQDVKPELDSQAYALVTSEGLAPFAYAVTGARALKNAAIAGVAVHMIGGILGMLMMVALAILGAMELLTPANMFLYELVWMIPGLLITEWTRSI